MTTYSTLKRKLDYIRRVLFHLFRLFHAISKPPKKTTNSLLLENQIEQIEQSYRTVDKHIEPLMICCSIWVRHQIEQQIEQMERSKGVDK